MRKLLIAVVSPLALCGAARAETPPPFTGKWCYQSQSAGSTGYIRWKKGCKATITVQPNGDYFTRDTRCVAANLKDVTQDKDDVFYSYDMHHICEWGGQRLLKKTRIIVGGGSSVSLTLEQKD
jgi:hypothetical protein